MIWASDGNWLRSTLDAVWIKGKIFELSETLASADAAAAAAMPAGGKVFALLIGVSKYQRLPKDQWLQFAEADATGLPVAFCVYLYSVQERMMTSEAIAARRKKSRMAV